MQRNRMMRKAVPRPITIRLPADEEAFYRRMASAGGMSLNGYLTNLLVQGAVAEKVADFEERMNAAIAAFTQVSRQSGHGITEQIALSVITCEALLAELVGAQDVKVLYRAQDAARAKLQRMQDT